MKKKIFMSLFSLIISFIGCKSNEEKFLQENKVYYYDTKDFEEFEENAPIKLNRAWQIQKEYSKKNGQTPENWLFFVVNDNYVFSSALNPKAAFVFLGGIWVNSKTGEAKKVNSEVTLKYKNVYNGDGKKFPF